MRADDPCDALAKRLATMPHETWADELRLYTVYVITSAERPAEAVGAAIRDERRVCARLAAVYDHRAADAIKARGSK